MEEVGISMSSEETEAAEVPIEQVEHLGDALKRLTQGAGKDNWDTVLVKENLGHSCNGVVTTEIEYPFGFEAKLAASALKSTLTHVRVPKVKVTAARVTLTESGKKFQLGKLIRDAEIPSWGKPVSEQMLAAQGSWMTRLLPILPSQVGNKRFPGIWACPDGYVGSDSTVLAWIEAPGPSIPGIVPREFIERLPSGPIQFGLDAEAGVAWAHESGTVWTGLLLHGDYPPWREAFFEPDRQVTLERKELLSAFRAVTSVSRTATLVTEGDPLQLRCTSTDVIDLRAKGTKGSIAEAVIPIVEHQGEPFQVRIDVHRLLAALEKTTGNAIMIGTEARMDRIVVRPLEMQPTYHLILMGIAGYGAI
jgi:hypothetical protein